METSCLYFYYPFDSDALFFSIYVQVTSPSMVSDLIGIPAITTPTYAKEFQKVIESAAKGRQVCTVRVIHSFFV